jgi:hypothetical protein
MIIWKLQYYLVKSSRGLHVLFKGTVRRDATGVENRLKRSVVTNYMTASLYFLILKRHHHEKSKKTGFSVLTTITLKLTGRRHIILQMTLP